MDVVGAAAAPSWTSKTFVKILHPDEVHHGLRFVDGLNVDPLPFQTSDECAPGGIYFCEPEHVFDWIHLYTKSGAQAGAQAGARQPWIRSVRLPPEARVQSESNHKWKADRVILGPRIAWDDWLSANPDVCARAVA